MRVFVALALWFAVQELAGVAAPRILTGSESNATFECSPAPILLFPESHWTSSASCPQDYRWEPCLLLNDLNVQTCYSCPGHHPGADPHLDARSASWGVDENGEQVQEHWAQCVSRTNSCVPLQNVAWDDYLKKKLGIHEQLCEASMQISSLSATYAWRPQACEITSAYQNAQGSSSASDNSNATSATICLSIIFEPDSSWDISGGYLTAQALCPSCSKRTEVQLASSSYKLIPDQCTKTLEFLTNEAEELLKIASRFREGIFEGVEATAVHVWGGVVSFLGNPFEVLSDSGVLTCESYLAEINLGKQCTMVDIGVCSSCFGAGQATERALDTFLRTVGVVKDTIVDVLLPEFGVNHIPGIELDCTPFWEKVCGAIGSDVKDNEKCCIPVPAMCTDDKCALFEWIDVIGFIREKLTDESARQSQPQSNLQSKSRSKMPRFPICCDIILEWLIGNCQLQDTTAAGSAKQTLSDVFGFMCSFVDCDLALAPWKGEKVDPKVHGNRALSRAAGGAPALGLLMVFCLLSIWTAFGVES